MGGMNSDKDVSDYMAFKKENLVLLEKFVAAGGDMAKTRKLVEEHGDLLVTKPHTSSYLLLACLEFEMEGNSAMMYKCAQQSQLLTHIKELAKSFQRPARDLVGRWFDKTTENEHAYKIYKDDVDQFAEKVKGRARDKRKEEAAEKARQREMEQAYVVKNMNRKPKDDGHDEDDYEVEYKRPEEVEGVEDHEYREAVPLVQAMRDMTKEQRLGMAPGGLDPLEVFEGLPREMQKCFEEQNIPALIELQRTMPGDVFNPHLMRCIKAG